MFIECWHSCHDILTFIRFINWFIQKQTAYLSINTFLTARRETLQQHLKVFLSGWSWLSCHGRPPVIKLLLNFNGKGHMATTELSP